MRFRKRSVTIPAYLDEIIEEAAARQGVSVSAFIVEAAETQMLTREAAERDAWEKANGIDRAAAMETADIEFHQDLAREAGQVRGAA